MRHYHLFLLLFCLPFDSYSQSDSIPHQQISEVEVLAIAKPSTLKSVAALQVMTQADIDRIGVQSISDAVRMFTGVVVKDYGGIGGLKTVGLRGLGAEHTAVLYDGIAINDSQSGQIDISKFSLDNISMLSITQGQSNDIFQTAKASASAGTLNIHSQKPQFADNKKISGQIQMKFGSWGLINPYIYFAHKLNSRLFYSFDLGLEKARGNYPYKYHNGNQVVVEKRTNSDVEILRTEFNLFGEISSTQKIDVKLNYFDSERGLPGAIILLNPDKSQERLWDKNFFIQSKYLNKFSEKVDFKLQGKYSHLFTRFEDRSVEQTNGFLQNTYSQNEIYLSSTLLYQITRQISTSLAQDISFNTLRSNYEGFVDPSRITSFTSFTSKFETKRFTLIGNLLGTYVKDDIKIGKNPDNKKYLSPSLNVSFLPLSTSNLRIRASYNEMFRVPTFNELYYKRVGNIYLKPEKNRQLAAGITWAFHVSDFFDFASITVDVYKNNVKDRLYIFPASFEASVINLGKVKVEGVDLTATGHYNILSQLKLQTQFSYSFMNALDKTDRSDKHYNHQLPYTAKHSGAMSLSVENPFLNVAYSFIASGKSYSEPQNLKRNEISPYFDHNVSINKTINIKQYRLRIQGEISNIGNKNYEIIKNYPMPGRAYRILCNLNF